MNYNLTITLKSTYLHAIVTGVNTKEGVVRYLEEIRRECVTRNCFRVLIEERLEGPRIGTMDVFELSDRGSSKAPGMFEAIAYVDVNAVSDSMHFAETVARNRGLPIFVFSTVAEAEKWLLETGGHEAGP